MVIIVIKDMTYVDDMMIILCISCLPLLVSQLENFLGNFDQ